MAHAKSSDPNVFILPDLGEGVHEAELVSWKVSPGETVEEHQVVAEMETDKALVEVPSPRDGVIGELFGEPGDILKVGEPAWTYAPGGEGEATQQATQTTTAEDALASNGQVEEEREDAGTVVGTMSGALGGLPAGEGKALATPAVRRLARDLGLDIDSVKGTGLAGRVTEKDVRAAASGGGAGAAPAARRAERREAPAASPAPAAEPAPARSVNELATTVEARSPQSSGVPAVR